MPIYGPNSWGTSGDDVSNGGTVSWTGAGSPGSPSAGGWMGSQISHYLKLTNFHFAIPTPPGGQGVQTILAAVQFSVSGTGWSAKDNSVKLLIGGVFAGNEQSIGAAWGASNQYPNVSDSVWGPSTLYTDVNSATFGLAIQGMGVGSPGGTATLVSATITVNVGLLEVPLTIGGDTNDQVVALRRQRSNPTPVPYRNSLGGFPPRRRFGPTIFTQTRTLRFERPLPLTFGAAA